MYNRKILSIGSLLLDVRNYRHGELSSQKAARDAIIVDQGKKLVHLAADILKEGMNPFDSPMVIEADDGNGNYVVVEGNRRLTAINILLEPSLASGTPIHRAFVKLHKGNADAIPKAIECVVAPSRESARVWIDRKHSIGLDGAGTESWSSMAKARADQDAGESRVDLDVVNFVLNNPKIDERLREHLGGSGFKLSTLQRLVTTGELQSAAGFELKDGGLVATSNKAWLQKVLTDVVTTIAEGEHGTEKFTERTVDSKAKREIFVNDVVGSHPGRKKAANSWTVTGKPMQVAKAKKPKPAVKATMSTEDQVNLIPKKFKLSLPAGKINDIFVELKTLDVNKHRHAISVLFRVFLEMSLDDYIEKHAVTLPKDRQGNTIEKLSVRLSRVQAHVKKSHLMTDKELKPINVAIGNRDDLLSPETLNAYVHSPLMNPDPMQLKIKWSNVQLFLERMWTSRV